MSELSEMNCREFSDVAAELALGVLTGRERAAAIAHLDQCDACRENVRQLTMTGEGLLELLPTREPPAGFESRVMERIGLATPAPAPAPAPSPASRAGCSTWASGAATRYPFPVPVSRVKLAGRGGRWPLRRLRWRSSRAGWAAGAWLSGPQPRPVPR